jgi:hypothetical protein
MECGPCDKGTKTESCGNAQEGTAEETTDQGVHQLFKTHCDCVKNEFGNLDPLRGPYT